MQVLPCLILIFALMIEFITSCYGIASNYTVANLHKWAAVACAVLCMVAMITSAILLILKRFSSTGIGLAVTFLSSIQTAVFTSYAVSWYKF